MGVLFVVGAIGVAIVASWIVGEVKNIRSLRLSAILLPIAIGPFAYQIGQIFGHGRVYETSRTHTCKFFDSAVAALNAGHSDAVAFQLDLLRKDVDDTPKHAGQFFWLDTEDSTYRLSKLKDQ